MIDESELSQAGLGQAQQILRRIIWQALDHELLPSAEFACERLLALDPENLDSVHLKALTLYRVGKYKSAYNLCSGKSRNAGCLYVYIMCCYKLGKYTDGIGALDGNREQWTNLPSATAGSDWERSSLPDAKTFELWNARLRMARGDFDFHDKENAVKGLASVVRQNPYLYESVDLLSKLRVSLQVDNIFKPEQLEIYTRESSIQHEGEPDPFTGSTTATTTNSAASTASSSFTFKTGQNFLKSAGLKHSDNLSTPTASSNSSRDNDSFSTPSDGSRSLATRTNLPLAPQKRSTRSRSNLSFDSKPPSFEAPKRQVRASTAAKRSTRNPQPSYTATTKKVNTTSTQPATKLKTIDKEGIARNEAAKYLASLYTTLTWMNVHFHKYRCKEAVDAFNQLSEQQQNTPWVLAKIARTHFELVNYSESLTYFQKLHEMNRCRVEDMEYYSTLLWHLQKDYDLGYLAHDLIDADRTAPQSWCALGNSFSLKKEPDLALKCFKRAIQLDPNSPYAYTLQAHEHVINDAYENAQDSFRQAIKADNRHYNAWYGLGMVAMRLGQVAQSEIYFKRAMQINPNNVVLICCTGMAFEKRGEHYRALEQYEHACELQPKSALSRYRKARTLINLKMYTQALAEFDELCTLAPDEASVHFLLGQLYKFLENRELAVKHFTIALNLDPKGSHLIKEALSGLNGENNSMSLST
ncbi:hypothetical protein TRICI_002133 [Trichomonascus ciferrii]|uniref:Cdc23 domain-containing protein n=1 Tax=Trichomonascus ciferrii TaxID=44093 RepID=A0A642V6N0_9ASCO|nr:hypothetical protein TRICI_002133 [Trichomonascus ciferrii]